MPDSEILKALPTHAPNPEFVAETRQLLSNAWRDASTLPKANDMNTQIQQRPPTSTDYKPASGPQRPSYRWIASAAAAILVILGGAVLVFNNRSNAPAVGTVPPSTASQPTTQQTNTSPTVSTPTGSTSPVATSPTPETTAAEPAVSEPVDTDTGLPSTQPVDPTTQPPTSLAPAAQNYVQATPPEWANVDVTDAVDLFPNDGVYGATFKELVGDEVTFTLSQLFLGDACNTHFSLPPDEYSDDCAGGLFEQTEPTATATTNSSTRVFADFDDNNQIVTYEISAGEFARLAAGEPPSADAPTGLNFWAGPVLVKVENGQVTAVRSMAWS